MILHKEKGTNSICASTVKTVPYRIHEQGHHLSKYIRIPVDQQAEYLSIRLSAYWARILFNL